LCWWYKSLFYHRLFLTDWFPDSWHYQTTFIWFHCQTTCWEKKDQSLWYIGDQYSVKWGNDWPSKNILNNQYLNRIFSANVNFSALCVAAQRWVLISFLLVVHSILDHWARLLQMVEFDDKPFAVVICVPCSSWMVVMLFIKQHAFAYTCSLVLSARPW
jgi:hypothetical protein